MKLFLLGIRILQLKSSAKASNSPSNMADSKHMQSMVSFAKLFLRQGENIASFEDLSDGVVFARMLETAESFRFSFGEIDQAPRIWVHKLRNLRFLVGKIQRYFEARLGKGIITKDIKLFEIAKHYSKQETLKFFQLIIAVLTQAPNKEDHIALIMAQDQSVQSAFVDIIQHILNTRIIPRNQTREMKVMDHLVQLEAQNRLFQSEMNEAHEQINALKEELNRLNSIISNKEKTFAEVIERFSEDPQQANHDLAILYEELKNSYEKVKDKMLEESHKNQLSEDRLKQQNLQLRKRISDLEEVEDTLQIYKQKYNESFEAIENIKKVQQENQVLKKLIASKEHEIKKLQEKVDSVFNERLEAQEKQLNLQIQLERKDIRFLELERELKKKISNIDDQSNTFTISDPTLESLTAQLQEMSLLDIDDIKGIKADLDRTTKRCKEIQKENFRLRRMSDRFSRLQEEKKKLQRIIFALTQDKNEETTLLVSTLQHFHEENQAFASILRQNKLLE